MKKNFKKLSSLALSLLLIFSLSLSAFAADVSAEQAKAIALADAGYKQADVAYIRAGVDYDNGVKEYDVEFLVKNADAYLEYDYEVRAADGKILSKDRDVEKINASAVGSGDIGKDAAVEAAYAAFGFSAAEVKLIKVQKDRDDGVVVYEVEYAKGYDCKYSVEVLAASGKVIDKERDVSRNFFDKVELFFEVLFAQLFLGR
ncbi:MAG: PepSY domain-containing protein [Clostridia bacterium]|nr:PepSY domain-containing protein [Clostridia bacterium]